MKKKVLICDDSAMARIVLKKIINKDPELEIEKAIKYKPDVVTMDVNMPVIDGLTALKEIVRKKIAPVVMISALTREGAKVTVEAMEEGAFDYIPKPGGTYSFDKDIKSSELGYKAVALGMSTGGPKSIFEVLPKLPKDLKAAILIIQHMPASFIKVFAQRIDSKTAMRCYESQPGMEIKPGNIYLGMGGYHLNLMRKSNGEVLIRQTKTPKTQFMPSVDEMMKSVSNVFFSDTIGVIMTGMGKDGTLGIKTIFNNGGITIAESESTAIVFGMPGEAIKTGAVSHIVPNWKISDEIIRGVKGG